jgi:hypothetical protein
MAVSVGVGVSSAGVAAGVGVGVRSAGVAAGVWVATTVGDIGASGDSTSRDCGVGVGLIVTEKLHATTAASRKAYEKTANSFW